MIQTIIEFTIEQFISNISNECNIDKHILQRIWLETNSSIEIKKSDNDKNNSPVKTNICTYVLTRGKNKGNICGKETKNSTYCQKHNKNETKKQTKNKKVPELKKTDIILRRHKPTNLLFHKDTSFLFDNDNIVISKLVNDHVVELNEDDLQVCNTWKFKYKLNINGTQTTEKTIEKTLPTKTIEKTLPANNPENMQNLDIEDVIDTLQTIEKNTIIDHIKEVDLFKDNNPIQEYLNKEFLSEEEVEIC